MIFHITLPGKPYPQPRIKVGRFGSYYPKGHTAKWQKSAEYLRVLADKQGWVKTDRPVQVTIDTVSKLPVKMHKRVVATGKRLYKPYRPDIDNYAKYVLDCISKAGNIWVDDNQVVVLTLRDFYGLKDEAPYTAITIQPIEEQGIL